MPLNEVKLKRLNPKVDDITPQNLIQLINDNAERVEKFLNDNAVSKYEASATSATSPIVIDGVNTPIRDVSFGKNIDTVVILQDGITVANDELIDRLKDTTKLRFLANFVGEYTLLITFKPSN